MLSKNEAKYIQSLTRKKQRQAEGVFIAEGVKLADELLQSDYRIRNIYATDGWIAMHTGTDATEVTADELQRISSLPTPNNVLVIAEQKKPATNPATKQALSLVLDCIQDPGNFGTIIRIADWFGITQIIASEDTVDLYNPKVIQSTMGSFTRVQVWYKSLSAFLQQQTIPVYGAVLNGRSIYDVSSVREGLLLIGNEGNGINPELLPFITHPITIPKSGGAESLNAAVATGILVAEMKR